MQNARTVRRSVDAAPHVTTGGLCRWKPINKVGRHVGLDFYDLLIEALIDRACRRILNPSNYDAAFRSSLIAYDVGCG